MRQAWDSLRKTYSGRSLSTSVRAFENNRVPQSVIDVVRFLRCGDFPQATAAFLRVPRSAQASFPALHEALVLACAHVPDAHAASAVLRDMPQRTLAAYSHAATAHCRERNPKAAVSLLESIPDAGLPLDPRLLASVARHIRNENARFRGRSGVEKEANGIEPLPSGKRPRSPMSWQASSLLERLESLKRKDVYFEEGVRGVSLSAADFFKDDGGNVSEWIWTRMQEHELSLTLIANAQSAVQPGAFRRRNAEDRPEKKPGVSKMRSSSLALRDASVRHSFPNLGLRPDLKESSVSIARDPSRAFRNTFGDVGKTDKLWKTVRDDQLLFADSTVLAAAVSAFLKCGWRGSQRALDAVHEWLAEHSVASGSRARLDSDAVSSLSVSPTRRAMLLTAATSAVAAAASQSSQKALNVCDSLFALPPSTFRESLPLCGTFFKVLRHARLPLHETYKRIKERRMNLIQLDEQGFSLALSALLESRAPPGQKWDVARQWVDEMQLAGISLTLHTYNSFAEHLRFLNDPEVATSLLRDMAQSGVTPSAYTYSLMFDSCVQPGSYMRRSRLAALPISTLLWVLGVIEEHMNCAGVAHTPASRAALARAYAHLGQEEIALRHFAALTSMSNTFECSETTDNSWEAHPRSCRQLVWNYNRLIYSFAHSRCQSPDGPGAAFRLYAQMRENDVLPNAMTLQSLLSACVRVGEHAKGLQYASDFTSLEGEGGPELVLGRPGLESTLAILAKSGRPASWATCETLFTRGILDAQKKQPGSPPVSRVSVELAVLSYARRGHEDICETLCRLSGHDMQSSNWQMLLNGKRDFERVRTVRRRRHDNVDGLPLHTLQAFVDPNTPRPGDRLNPASS